MKLQFIDKDWLMKYYYLNFKQFIKYYINYYSITLLVTAYLLVLALFMSTIGVLITEVIITIFNFHYYILTDLLISIIPSIIIFTLMIYYDYKCLNVVLDKELNRLQDKLNEKYVNKYDNEKVYLLYELIENNDLIFKDKYNTFGFDDYNISVKLFELKIDDDQYIQFNNAEYQDNDVKTILNDKILQPKLLSKNESLQFYDKYLNNTQKIKSLEEYVELEKRLKDKNIDRKSEDI